MPTCALKRSPRCAKTKSRQLARVSFLARSDTATQQALDQAENDEASARADIAEATANHDAAVVGPTREGARHHRCPGQGRGVCARGDRATLGQDHLAGPS